MKVPHWTTRGLSFLARLVKEKIAKVASGASFFNCKKTHSREESLVVNTLTTSEGEKSKQDDRYQRRTILLVVDEVKQTLCVTPFKANPWRDTIQSKPLACHNSKQTLRVTPFKANPWHDTIHPRHKDWNKIKEKKRKVIAIKLQ